jgi:hypothetical protein
LYYKRALGERDLRLARWLEKIKLMTKLKELRMQKLLVLIALCFATILGVISPAWAEPLKVRFSSRCDSPNGKALVQYETGQLNGSPANIGFFFLADGATTNAELAGFPPESFRNLTATVRATAGSIGKPFSVTVRSAAPDGLEYSGTAVVVIPLNNTAAALSITPAQLIPPMPADTRLKDITFNWKNPQNSLAQLRITGLAVNSQLSSFSMSAQLSVCP